MRSLEYEEVRIPDDVQVRAEKLSQLNPEDPATEPTMKNTGFVDWLNERGKDGWMIVWSQFRHPHVLFEREIVVEEVEK